MIREIALLLYIIVFRLLKSEICELSILDPLRLQKDIAGFIVFAILVSQ